MINLIPIFPLGLVAYPGEQLNLHIFEPRYKQLVAECAAQKKPFGIPAVIDGRVMDYGTTVVITEISKQYDNGEMDIKTKGQQVFKILETIKTIPDKLYSGAIVDYPRHSPQGSRVVMQQLVSALQQLHLQMLLNKKYAKPADALTTYDIAHHAALSLQQEYELLQLPEERQRQEYLRRHLEQLMPAMSQLSRLREVINQNGHFRGLPGFDV